MSGFFNAKVLNKIKNNESSPKKLSKFITSEYCEELLDYRKSISGRLVDREESTKVPFVFEDSALTKNLKNKIEEECGEFSVRDFEPHFITTRFPLRIHADTGKDPNDVIFKNIVIPLEINHDSDLYKNKTSHTLIFKNKWYFESALFTTKTKDNYDFIIKDYNENFVDIIDIFKFKQIVDDTESDKFIEYKGNKFLINEKFKNYIKNLSETKRYNQRTDKHILNTNKFDIELYEKYMSHQPYDDCTGLELDEAISWEAGSLIYWDRVRIHSSDNFIKNGIKSKTCIALFTSKE